MPGDIYLRNQKHIGEHIDCRSFAEHGIDEQPTIHEGVTACIMKKQNDKRDEKIVKIYYFSRKFK
jgi:hypothetical protein